MHPRKQSEFLLAQLGRGRGLRYVCSYMLVSKILKREGKRCIFGWLGGWVNGAGMWKGVVQQNEKKFYRRGNWMSGI